MLSRNIARRALLAISLAALLASPALSFATPTLSPSENAIDARQFHIDNARLPGPAAGRQSVTAWQVSAGNWNGQTLDGLSLVLVQSTTESGRSSGETHCYISHEATPAQREALLGAFFAAQPQLLPPGDGLRVEPAVITLEIDGQSVVLHLGLIA